MYLRGFYLYNLSLLLTVLFWANAQTNIDIVQKIISHMLIQITC